MKADPQRANVSSRGRALIDYAVALTRQPASITESQIDVLRAAGLSDAAIHDTVAVTAYFNFVNRIALGLGVELEVTAS